MKPITFVLVACGFAAGLAFGQYGAFGKAANGLESILAPASSLSARLPKVTALVQTARDTIQPADVVWRPMTQDAEAAICTPKGKAGHAALPNIEHL